MAKRYRTPGVYMNEISLFPPSVPKVETAIPAFIGFTQNDTWNGTSLVNKPHKITSLQDYFMIYGFAPQTQFTNSNNPSDGIVIRKDNNGNFVPDGPLNDPFEYLQFRMYYCLLMYFNNGGGSCYIVSCGRYENAVLTNANAMKDGLEALRDEDEPTIILFSDAPSLSENDFYNLYTHALAQSGELMDRFVIADVYLNLTNQTRMTDFKAGRMDMNYTTGSGTLAENFRTGIGNNNLSYGAVYFPWLQTSLPWYADESLIPVSCDQAPLNTVTVLRKYPAKGQSEVKSPHESLYHVNYPLYNAIKNEMNNFRVILPPSSAIAGVYATVDRNRGVWKAPANVSINSVKKLMVDIDAKAQREMTVSRTGKSINAIRLFRNRGNMVWGARTLAGNDPEWKYINTRRYFNMVQESVKKALESYAFESNNVNTWNKVKAMTENFLMVQWRAGALAGNSPGHAYFTNVGLGQTMTITDINEGRMIVEIGLALAKPAEFILLRIIQNMNNV